MTFGINVLYVLILPSFVLLPIFLVYTTLVSHPFLSTYYLKFIIGVFPINISLRTNGQRLLHSTVYNKVGNSHPCDSHENS